MKRLSTKTNVAAPSVAYPYGNIRNKTLLLAGTPVDVEVYGDIHQFFEKMFDASGITANGLPDNVTNGFQLFEAFTKLTHPAWSTTGLTFATGGAYSWANAGSPFLNCAFKAMPNEVALCGVAESGVSASADTPVMTLPVGARPSADVYVLGIRQDGGGARSSVVIKIESSGVVTAIALTATLGTWKIYLDGIRFRK
jgi:hypothetical protein